MIKESGVVEKGQPLDEGELCMGDPKKKRPSPHYSKRKIFNLTSKKGGQGKKISSVWL